MREGDYIYREGRERGGRGNVCLVLRVYNVNKS